MTNVLRWEMEALGEFSLEGCIEMAWIMNLIKYHNSPLKDGTFYIGWVDAATLSPVQVRFLILPLLPHLFIFK
jgi:fatty acid synthase subunit alpha, fungi type